MVVKRMPPLFACFLKGSATRFFIFLSVTFPGVIAEVYSQASLPVSRSEWNAGAPTGWMDGNGTTPAYTTTFACSGSNGGRLDNNGEYYTVNFNSEPDQLEYTLKVSGATTSSCLVEESADGSSWSTIVNHTSLPGSCTVYSYSLSSTSRYVRWAYTKVTENLTIDDVSITVPPCTPPSGQATSFSTSSVTTGSMTVDWARGNGDNVLVIAKAATAPSDPSPGTSYTGNAAYGSGSAVGGGFAVYNGTGTSVNITGLANGTTYYFAIYEYSNTGVCYNTTELTGSETTIAISSSSDIISAGGQSATISSMENDAAPLASTDGAQVWQFTIRDGGGAGDADAFSTILENLTMSQNAGNQMGNWLDAIKSANLFDGATHVGAAVITSSQLQFTGMSVTVADNSSKTISLRISLNCGMADAGNIDGDDFVFQISNANVSAGAGSSGFTTFTAINSTNGQNVFSVTATELDFINQPSSTGINLPMSTVTVQATDACGNKDLNFTGNISISSDGTLSGDPVTAAAVSGVVTFSSLIHTVLGTSLTLTASAGGFTSEVSTFFDIVLSTTFEPGDFAIVAVNTQRTGSGSADEVCFVTFKNISPGTSFDITDNGYERVSAGLWGDTEGTMRFTRSASASAIPAGTVICIEGPDNAYDGNGVEDFDIYVCGAADDANWTGTNIAGGAGMDWNSSDQVWIMQGGTWNGVGGSHNDTYTGGNVLYGWTAISWETAPGYSSTSGSTLYPNKECFSTDVAAPGDKTKYTGPTTAASHYAWISRINDENNWTNYADNAAYDAGGTDYYLGSCVSTGISIDPGTEVEGQWSGLINTDWFTCNNWETLVVPDTAISAIIPDVTNDPVIAVAGALCADIHIQPGAVLTINGTGTLSVYGDFDNDGTFTHTAGSVTMAGISAADITGDNAIDFYNCQINKSGADITLLRDVEISNILTLNDGVIITGANRVFVSGSAHDAIAGFSSASFINGNLRRNIAGNTETYEFPVGFSSGTSGYFRADFINNNITGVTYIDASVNSITNSGNNIDSRLNTEQDGTPIDDIAETAEWNLLPDAAPSGGSYGVKLYTANISGLTDNQFCPVKRPDASADYADWLTYDAGTVIPAAGVAGRTISSGYAQRTGYTAFSKFAVGKSSAVLPVELLSFDAKPSDRWVELNWKTAIEINNDYFTVERSPDGENFEPAGYVKGSGNSNVALQYNFTDRPEVPDIGAKNILHYRLKQTDYDGESGYSHVVAVMMSGSNSLLPVFYADPGERTISFFPGESADAPFLITITDVAGKILLKKYFYTQWETGRVDCSSLPAGLYFFRIGNGTRSTVRKFIFY